MLKFAEPSYLNWAAFFIIAGFVLMILEQARFRKFQEMFGKKLGPFLTSSVSQSKKRWKTFLQCAALACFAIALARPQLGSRQEEIKQTGIEMIIALDVSNSMLAEDDKPSRLAHAKREISRLLDKLSGDQVGIIAFAGNAVLIAPLTADYAALKMFVDGLTPDSVSSQGTNIRSVLDVASKAFERGGVEGDQGPTATRVVLLASDGEETEPGAMGAIKKAVDSGIRVFAIGFGSARGAPIPLRDERGNLTGYKKDQSGQTVMTMPSDDLLGSLARNGGGSYYHATFEETELSSLIQDFTKLQKADFQSKMSVSYDERFQIPLALGLLLAFFDLLLTTRKVAATFWRGRFEVAR